ncbi:MAG: methylenetetrahydrofolate reductase C-terminal domain-containing protein [Dehalococcoidia bacterium]
MIETRYKSAEELRFSIGENDNVAIISCGACANLCDVGGVRGMNFIKGLVEGWGNKVTASKTIAACCPQPIMKQAQQSVLRKSDTDKLIVISCAAGVKSAILCEPGIPVIAACDTVGASSLVHPGDYEGDMIAESLCKSCGHCVISYTAGICPVALCPARSLYGPCSKAPEDGVECTLDTQRDCVWREIERRGGNLELLQKIKEIHQSPDMKRLPSFEPKSHGALIRKYVGLAGGLIPAKLLEIVHWAR